MTDERGAPDSPDNADMLAAEYALGLLEGEARAVAEARVAADAQFAAQVARWKAVGTDWALAAPPDPEWSPNQLGARLAASFPPEPEARALPLPANDADPLPATSRAASGWRAGTLAASFAALALGGLYLGERTRAGEFAAKLAVAEARGPQASAAVRVAQISQADGKPLLTVLYEGQGGRLTARIASIDSTGLVPELWVIGPDGKPRSLGQGSGGSVFVVELTEQMRADIAAGSVIAISLEQAADRPSAQPTAERILGAAQLAPVT